MTEHTPIKNRGFSFHTDNRDTFYNTLLEPAIDRLDLSPADRKRLDWVVNGKSPTHVLSMLNRNVHRMTYRHLSQGIIDFYESVAYDLTRDRRFYFLTACWNDGLTSVVEPVRNLYRMKQKVSQVLYKYDLSGVCMVETSPYRTAILGFDHRPVWFHIHGIVWSDDPCFDHQAMAKNEQKRFPNALGIPGFKLTTRADYARDQRAKGFPIDDGEDDTTIEDLAFLVAYMSKRPTHMKRPEKLFAQPERTKFKKQEDLCSGKLALQLGRIWSMLTPYDVIFGVNEGKAPRGVFAQAMRDWDQANRRKRQKIEPFDLERLWQRITERNPGVELGECRLTAR